MNFRRSLDWWLAVAGAALLLLYMPNGAMHLYLGKLVYGRDLALAAHFAITIFCLVKTGHFPTLRKSLLPMLALALFFAPLLLKTSTLKDGFTAVKWFLLWTDAMLTGYLIFLQRRWVKTIAAVAVAAMGLITLDATIGAYELRTNSFFFQTSKDDETEAGVQVARSQQLEGQVRIQGLQRGVFTFANFMAIGFVTCLCFIVAPPHWAARLAALPMAAAYLYMIVKSGGRSTLLGIALTCALATLAMFSPQFFRRHARKILVGAVIGGGALCVSGLGRILEFFVTLTGAASRTFNLASTYERDWVWADRLSTILGNPASLLTGMPFAEWMGGDPPDVLFVDNQILWFVYHTGLVGTAVILGFLYHRARPLTLERYPQAFLALILFMGLVLGESVAREGMLLFSALPLFMLCGFFIGADAYADEMEDDEAEEFAEEADVDEETHEVGPSWQ